MRSKDAHASLLLSNQQMKATAHSAATVVRLAVMTVRSVRVLQSPCVLLRSGSMPVPIGPPSLIRLPYKPP